MMRLAGVFYRRARITAGSAGVLRSKKYHLNDPIMTAVLQLPEAAGAWRFWTIVLNIKITRSTIWLPPASPF